MAKSQSPGLETELSLSSVAEEKKVDWVRLDVLNVAGTTANMNLTGHFNNSTQTVLQSINADVQNAGSMGKPFLVASNLTAGEPLSPQTPQITINQTLTRMYAGANRNVNMIDIKSSYQGYPSETKIYWDQNTGIMVEMYTNQTDYTNPSAYEELSVKTTETNLWSANIFDLIQSNLIYIIAGIAVIVIIVAVTVILRRRTPSSQQPPPPSAPLPPPS